jgi:hypothetical protein
MSPEKNGPSDWVMGRRKPFCDRIKSPRQETSLFTASAMSQTHATETRLSLTIRTSLLCEFRNPSGLLQAFEVCHGQTTFGVLCGALLRMPGVEFVNHDPNAWFPRPAQFTFRGELYEVSIPFDNIRVAPVEIGKALIEMEELLEYVRHNVLRTRIARYTVR